MSREV